MQSTPLTMRHYLLLILVGALAAIAWHTRSTGPTAAELAPQTHFIDSYEMASWGT